MVEGRSLLGGGAVRLNAAQDLDYCRRLSAYLGLSLETAILLTRHGASSNRPASRADAKARAAR